MATKAVRSVLFLGVLALCLVVLGAGTAAGRSEVVLTKGDHGSAVSKVQKKLGLTPDGEYGPQTVRAVKRFQRRHHLRTDGAVGPATRRALGLGAFSSRSVSGGGASFQTPSRSARVPAVLRRIAECESGGDPTAVSKSGRYRGKYQFDLATWRSLGGHGDPIDAAESVQDRLAVKLYKRRGTSPWGACASS
ncbi:MAG TPA: transglycosylase family protein [Thermoanaerobaculia bacterium]